MDTLFLLLVLVVLPLVWLISTYNGLIRLRNHCRESWSDIETELKRRHDLIPQLVRVVQGYAAHELQLFQEVAAARNRVSGAGADVGALARAENGLVHAVGRVLAVAEAFPELRADQHFLALQRELVRTEDRIQAARRFFNANVRDLNTRVESVPSNLIANLAGITTAGYFEVDDLSISRAPV